MSTNAKLAAGLVALLALGAVGFLLLRDDVRVGAMEHPAGNAADEGGLAASPTPPTSQTPPPRGGLFRIQASLSPSELRALRGIEGVKEVQPFLLVGEEDGGPAQGVGAGTRLLVWADGRALVPQLLWGRLFVPASEQRAPVAIAGRRWAETHKSSYGYIVSGMGHPTPVEIEDVALTVLGVFETAAEINQGLVMPLAVAQRIYGRKGTSGAWIRAKLTLSALERSVREALGRPLDVAAGGR